MFRKKKHIMKTLEKVRRLMSGLFDSQLVFVVVVVVLRVIEFEKTTLSYPTQTMNSQFKFQDFLWETQSLL